MVVAVPGRIPVTAAREIRRRQHGSACSRAPQAAHLRREVCILLPVSGCLPTAELSRSYPLFLSTKPPSRSTPSRAFAAVAPLPEDGSRKPFDGTGRMPGHSSRPGGSRLRACGTRCLAGGNRLGGFRAARAHVGHDPRHVSCPRAADRYMAARQATATRPGPRGHGPLSMPGPRGGDRDTQRRATSNHACRRPASTVRGAGHGPGGPQPGTWTGSCGRRRGLGRSARAATVTATGPSKRPQHRRRRKPSQAAAPSYCRGPGARVGQEVAGRGTSERLPRRRTSRSSDVPAPHGRTAGRVRGRQVLRRGSGRRGPADGTGGSSHPAQGGGDALGARDTRFSRSGGRPQNRSHRIRSALNHLGRGRPHRRHADRAHPGRRLPSLCAFLDRTVSFFAASRRA